jgi:predicted RNA-binding protein with PUA-like domain
MPQNKTKQRFWVYKCNSRRREKQVLHGDWEKFFAGKGIQKWGSNEYVRDLARLGSGDLVLGYQSNRREAVGLARVARLKPRASYLDVMMEPLVRLNGRLKAPLKTHHPKLAAMSAFQQGPVLTLYPISQEELDTLLKEAHCDSKLVHSESGSFEIVSSNGDARRATDDADETFQQALGQGFKVTPAVREAVERLAMDRAKSYFRSLSFDVADVSSMMPYDLRCERPNRRLFVEVKGTTTMGKEVLLTPREVDFARKNKKHMALFVLHSIKLSRRRGRQVPYGGEQVVVKPWNVDSGSIKPLVNERECLSYVP